MATLTAAQKEKKAEANKAYRARKKEETLKLNWVNMDKFEMSFDHKVRLFKNLKLEKENSYCASPGTLLKFELIFNDNENRVYRVRRTGRRTFFTTNNELKAPSEG